MSESSRSSTARILLTLGRLALAGVFLFAAYAKLRPQAATSWSVGSIRISLALFAMQVDSYQLLPAWAVRDVAHVLPFFELVLGLWLLSGWRLRASSALTTLLLAGFFGVMVRTYALGLEINCGCFGPGEALGKKTLLRDGMLLALSIAVMAGAFLMRRRLGETPVGVPAGTPQQTE